MRVLSSFRPYCTNEDNIITTLINPTVFNFYFCCLNRLIHRRCLKTYPTTSRPVEVDLSVGPIDVTNEDNIITTLIKHSFLFGRVGVGSASG